MYTVWKSIFKKFYYIWTLYGNERVTIVTQTSLVLSIFQLSRNCWQCVMNTEWYWTHYDLLGFLLGLFTVPFGAPNVPFGAPNVPFGSAPKPIMCPLVPPQNQHIFNSHLNYLNLKLSGLQIQSLVKHWTELKCFVDSSTHATNVWYWQSLHSRWWAWSWDTICALWPVNSGENTALLGSKVRCPLETRLPKVSIHSVVQKHKPLFGC